MLNITFKLLQSPLATCSRKTVIQHDLLQNFEQIRFLAFGDQLTKPQIDKILRLNERHVPIQNGAIESYETNQLSANNPCEDNYSEAINVPTGSYLFGVFDGHGGRACSATVSRRLYDYIAIALLKKTLHDISDYASLLHWLHCSSGETLSNAVLSLHSKHLEEFVKRCELEKENLANVKLAFQAAFLAMDNDLSTDALGSLDVEQPNKDAFEAIYAGSCACVAHVRSTNLHVANVGDCSALLGVCNEHGQWSVLPLTKAHCVDNPDEEKRVRSEHPVKEATTVVRGGRLLSQLIPLRAFGDVRFKWAASVQERVRQTLPRLDPPPPGLETPPYLTASPDVFYHRLTENDKFLVIASDGLWDCLTPEQVVQLISDHMVGRETLNPYIRTPDATVESIYEDLLSRKLGEDKKPQDENSATHLIRHALGGSGVSYRQYKYLNAMLSLPSGVARSYRDDISVIIVYFDTEYIRTHSTNS